MKKRYRLLSAAIFFLILGIAQRKLLPNPYVWNFTFLSWAVTCAFLVIIVRKAVAQYFLIGAASLFFALFAAETLFGLGFEQTGQEAKPRNVPIEDIRADKQDPELLPFNANLIKRDPELGYRPKPEKARVASRHSLDGKIISDVLYTFDEQGRRITPSRSAAKNAVAVFGCSVAFGLGLNDSESIPYVLGQVLGTNWQVYNLAYSGYGAHQMLAQIQGGVLDAIVPEYERVEVIFLTIPSHETRSAGEAGWDQYGPWYVLENGRAARKGNFTDRPRRAFPVLEKIMRDSLVFQRLFRPPAMDQDEAITLHAAIIAEADIELNKRYGIRIKTALWPGAPFGAELARRNVPLVDLYSAFPEDMLLPPDQASGHNLGLTGENLLFMDNHPNAKAAKYAAQGLADSLVK
ncbi:MAG: hypothetical protein LBH65_00345 [Desulfovibrio sp.]|jgi:hypothetical protein|nr:hypothetical protein [Desulfovibrio sp.]